MGMDQVVGIATKQYLDLQEQSKPTFPFVGSLRIYADPSGFAVIDSNGNSALPLTTLPSNIDGGTF